MGPKTKALPKQKPLPQIKYKIKKKKALTLAAPKALNVHQKERLKSDQFKHQWQIRLHFDVYKNEIVIMIGDIQTDKEWRKVMTVHDMKSGVELREYYLYLGSLINDGDARYEYPPNGVGSVQVMLCKDDEIFKFTADPK